MKMTSGGSSGPGTPQAEPWLVFAESTRGSAHEGMGLPNQDSYRSAEIALGDGEGVVVAVADGHGNWRHFRSASGSRFAVDAACECVGSAAHRLGSSRSITEIEAVAKDEIIPSILEQWRSMVASDVAFEPFTDSEDVQRAEGDTPEIAYGSTLMLVVWMPESVLCIQIGDGDIVGVQPDGSALLPVPVDPSLDGHRTTSLCQTTALDSFRLGTVDRSASTVAAMLLATDGYGNSQVAEPWQPVLSAELAEMLEQKGPAWVGSRLKEWTDRCASPEGSGDDTTVALILTPDRQGRGPKQKVARPRRRWLVAAGLVVLVAAIATVLGLVLSSGQTGKSPVKPSSRTSSIASPTDVRSSAHLEIPGPPMTGTPSSVAVSDPSPGAVTAAVS